MGAYCLINTVFTLKYSSLGTETFTRIGPYSVPWILTVHQFIHKSPLYKTVTSYARITYIRSIGVMRIVTVLHRCSFLPCKMHWVFAFIFDSMKLKVLESKSSTVSITKCKHDLTIIYILLTVTQSHSTVTKYW